MALPNSQENVSLGQFYQCIFEELIDKLKRVYAPAKSFYLSQRE